MLYLLGVRLFGVDSIMTHSAAVCNAGLCAWAAPLFALHGRYRLGLLKINRLSGPEGKTGRETAGLVNRDRAIVQCLHITALTAPRTNFATAAAFFTSLFYTPKQRNICCCIQHSVGLQ